MNRANFALIADLAQDLKPVRAFRATDGFALTAAGIVVSIALVAATNGLWDGPLTGEASPFFFLANGLLVLFGLACAANAVRMASPGVGNHYGAAHWPLAMLAVLPLVAVLSLSRHGLLGEVMADPYGMHCLLSGSATGIVTAAALTGWLRRGAPVDTRRAGLMVGLAAGALGSATYGLSCPADSLAHVAIWHILPVALCGAIGRVVLPRIMRW